MLEDLIREYEWVKQIDGWTVAVIKNRSSADVLNQYGGGSAKLLGNFTFKEAADRKYAEYDRTPGTNLIFDVQIHEHEGNVIAIEENGWIGSAWEIARALSDNNGHFFSVYWNINAFGTVVEAQNGDITADLNSLWPVTPDDGEENRPLWAIGPETDVDVAWQTSFALMQQQTGVQIREELLTTKLPTYRIPGS